MGYVGNSPAEKYTTIDKQVITGNGTVGPYTLTHSVGNEQEIEVFVNNVRQEPGVAYTVSANQLTMGGTVAAADDFYIVFQGKAKMTATHPPTFDLNAANGTFTGNLTVDTNTLYVDSTNNRVGVGTSSPSQKLDVAAGGKLYLRRADNATGTEIYNGGSAVGTVIDELNNEPISFKQGGSEKMRISSGNVGIGTAPNNLLEVRGTSSGQQVLHLSNAAGASQGGAQNDIRVTAGGNTYWGDLNINAYNMKFSPQGTEAMRIDSSGRLLIGATVHSISGSQKFEVQGGMAAFQFNNDSASPVIIKNNNSVAGNGVPHIVLQDSSGNRGGIYRNASSEIGLHGQSALTFHTGSTAPTTERIRIDSSGNLLVGTTDTVPSNNGAGGDAGLAFTPDGAIRAARSGNNPLDINRMDNDGDIAAFRKDGGTVGSIGVSGGNNIYISGQAAAHSGLTFATNQILPTAQGSITDGAESLGNSSNRFSDLYLSGGVLLGGVGSANYLDDYEEGTWTPQIWKNATQVTSPISALGVYRKIGNVIFYSFYFYKSSGSNTDNNEWTLRGMPFSMEAGGNGAYVSLTSDYTGINSVNYFNQSGSHRWQANGNAYFSLYGPQSTTQWTTGYLEFSGSGFVYAL